MKKQTVLITGASSGIGYELAHVFARHGHDLVLVARRKERLETLASELRQKHGRKVWIFSCNLAEKDEISKLYYTIQNAKIQIDILVNNAGVGYFGEFAKSDFNISRNMIVLNMMALTYLTHLFLPGMIKCGRGKILNLASTASFQPGPFMAVYFASKAYVLSFSEAIGNELIGTGVTVTALCPGGTSTEFQKIANHTSKSKLLSKRMMTANEVAEIGYAGLMKNKAIVIPGFINKLMAISVRFIPRFFVTKITRRIVKSA